MGVRKERNYFLAEREVLGAEEKAERIEKANGYEKSGGVCS